MIRAAVKFGIAALLIYVAWNVGPVYVAHRQLKTDVAQATRDYGRGPEEELVTAVLALTNRTGALVDGDDIQVYKDATYTYLRLAYTEQLHLLPGFIYPWTFTISAQGLAISAQLGNSP
jgi:hypothetical protein